MTYKYFINDIELGKTNGDLIKEVFQEVVHRRFYNAPDIYTVKEQNLIGSDEYTDIDVRINRGIGVYTGRNLGDDWRLLIFKNVDHPIIMGKKYFFDNNYWLTFNTETYNNFAVSCMVKRCNNVLRWIDEDGVRYNEPCIFDLVIARARDQMSSDDLVNLQGYINVYAQLNQKTQKIRENQRFLIGNPENRVGYKVFGGGLRNFINGVAYDDYSASMLMLTMGGSHVNDSTDDIINGYANAFKLTHEIKSLPTYISGKPTSTYQLFPQLYRADEPIEGKIFNYTSSNIDVATVNSSGLVSMVGEGLAEITVAFADNTDVEAIVNVEVSSISDVPAIVVTPEPSYIIEGRTETFDCQLYLGGVLTPASFVFAVSENNTAPLSSFVLRQIDEHTFSVKNVKRSPYNNLKINCITGANTYEITIILRGVF
jgi:hypothetical protein